MIRQILMHMEHVGPGLSVALALAMAGCTDSDTPDNEGTPWDTDTNTSSSTPAPSCDFTVDVQSICASPATGSVNLVDANNYSFWSELNISSTAVQGNTNLLFDWGQLTHDFLGRSLDPLIDIDMLVLTTWDLGPDELMQKINDDVVMQSDMSAVVMAYGEDVRTSEYLLNFKLFDNPVTEEDIMPYFDVTNPNYDPNTFTHMVMAATGETAGQGSRMLQFFYLDPNSTATSVYIADDSTTLDYSVDLRSLQRLGVQAGAGGLITVDWSYVTENSMGLPFSPNRITEAVIANFATMNVCDMEEGILDLLDGGASADSWYRTDITEGTSLTFSDLALADGTPFQGIDNNGIWILALYCTSCSNPAPKFMTILQSCG